MIVSRSVTIPDAVPADYLAALRATGSVRTAALEHAFAAVPRHRCVAGFWALETHVYPNAGHLFTDSGHPDHNLAAAGLAWRRSLAFLAATW